MARGKLCRLVKCARVTIYATKGCGDPIVPIILVRTPKSRWGKNICLVARFS